MLDNKSRKVNTLQHQYIHLLNDFVKRLLFKTDFYKCQRCVFKMVVNLQVFGPSEDTVIVK